MNTWRSTYGFQYMKLLAASGGIILLSACAAGSDTARTSGSGDQNGQLVSMDSCDTASIRYAIGEAFDEANVSQLQSESQSRQVRVLRPGDVATMDHRPDRLNIHVDSNETVEALRCG